MNNQLILATPLTNTFVILTILFLQWHTVRNKLVCNYNYILIAHGLDILTNCNSVCALEFLAQKNIMFVEIYLYITRQLSISHY